MYVAASASWNLGAAVISVFLLLIGAGMLVYAFKTRGRPRAKIMEHPVFPAFFGICMMLAGIGSLTEGIALTKKCIAPGNAAGVRDLRGTIDAVKLKGKPGASMLDIEIGGERFTTAGLGSRSECGFKASLGQSIYPRTGAPVEGKAVGSTIVELREVK